MTNDDLDSDRPISDDQELAKALAGVGEQIDQPLQQEEYQPEQNEDSDNNNQQKPDTNEDGDNDEDSDDRPSTSGNNDLDTIKNEAINDLRPLVGKLNISAEEKFDTYLLLIRSTDDKSLVGPAYKIAKTIEDEAHKAQALLEIIKEVDYFSNNQTN